MLSDLKETAKIEGYANDSINAQFEILEKMLKHNLNRDLDNNRKEISELLANEIIKRYYYQKGQIIESLKNDIALDSAAVILNDLNAYRKILSPIEK